MNADEILRLAVECQLLTTENRNGIYAGALIRFANCVRAKALAEQPAEQEPVAVVKAETLGMRAHIIGDVSVGDLLYKAAPQPAKREPLTDEEINEAYGDARVKWGHIPHDDVARIARAIERAHGIGGQS